MITGAPSYNTASLTPLSSVFERRPEDLLYIRHCRSSSFQFVYNMNTTKFKSQHGSFDHG